MVRAQRPSGVRMSKPLPLTVAELQALADDVRARMEKQCGRQYVATILARHPLFMGQFARHTYLAILDKLEAKGLLK